MTGEELDRRLHAFRPDLADICLQDQVAAPRFVTGADYAISSPTAPIHREPTRNAMMESEALMGEHFRVFDAQDGWAWGQLSSDAYVGYVPERCLLPASAAPKSTHYVSALRTFVYPQPDLREPYLLMLSIGCQITVLDETTKRGTTYAWVQLPNGQQGAVIANHTRPLGEPLSDWVAVAEMFVHTPYLWGGRSSLGLDCSALVQLSRLICGLPTLRDSDMQAKEGEILPLDDGFAGLERGDLVFWPGHVAIMLDDTHIIHANGYHMATAIEPLTTAAARISDHYGSWSHASRPVHAR